MTRLLFRISLAGAALLFGTVAAAQTAPARPPATAPTAGAATVTWHRDVLPIVRDRCQVCHEPEGVGAFPLLTHAQALEHLSEIGEAVRTGYMPPWQPADGCQSFRDARRLTKREADIILAWVAQGGPAGVVTAVPPTPRPTGLSPVDVTLTAAPGGPSTAESTRCYAFTWGSEKERDVTAYEVEPGPGVQHVTLFTAPDLNVKALDAADDEPGWACSGEPGTLNAQVVGVWAPGSDITRLPPTTGIRLPAGAPFVMQVHSTATPAGRAPVPTVAKLQFSREPVKRPASFLPVWKSNYSLPSKSTGFTLNRIQPMTEDGVLLGVFPHMHGLGRRIKLEAGNACVIDIPYWDTTAQQAYFFESLVGVPVRAGSRVTLTCTWNNPSTSRVRSGEGAGKEMCLAWLYLTR